MIAATACTWLTLVIAPHHHSKTVRTNTPITKPIHLNGVIWTPVSPSVPDCKV